MRMTGKDGHVSGYCLRQTQRIKWNGAVKFNFEHIKYFSSISFTSDRDCRGNPLKKIGTKSPGRRHRQNFQDRGIGQEFRDNSKFTLTLIAFRPETPCSSSSSSIS